MPGMSGLELQEELIARQAPLPIVFITGHGDVPMAFSTMKKGAVDFLEKPFNDTDLCTIVARMLWQAGERVSQAQAQKNPPPVLSRLTAREQQIGRASGRDRVWQYVEIMGVDASSNKKKQKTIEL